MISAVLPLINEDCERKMKAKTIEKYILQQTGIDINIVRAKGYFYFWSNNTEVLNKLDVKYTTSVYVNSLNQLTPNQWLKEFINIWES